MINTNFQCERKLAKLNPEYHKIVRSTAVVMSHLLDKYTTHFPDYTDHSSLHALQVIDFCNQLIGDQIDLLNEDEIFILLMSCYLHDTGMGISDKDYEELKKRIVSPEYLAANPNADVKQIIREYHQDFSGGFIEKYAGFFDIPTPEHVKAITLVSRGHRRTPLDDSVVYPDNYTVPNGNRIALPYLASLIRLADELDIAADRNILFEYSEHDDDIEWRKHKAIKHMEITETAFVLDVSEDDKKVLDFVDNSALKLQGTLDYCRRITAERTPFKIKQQFVFLRRL